MSQVRKLQASGNRGHSQGARAREREERKKETETTRDESEGWREVEWEGAMERVVNGWRQRIGNSNRPPAP
jgi:hypothetical protein